MTGCLGNGPSVKRTPDFPYQVVRSCSLKCDQEVTTIKTQAMTRGSIDEYMNLTFEKHRFCRVETKTQPQPHSLGSLDPLGGMSSLSGRRGGG